MRFPCDCAVIVDTATCNPVSSSNGHTSTQLDHCVSGQTEERDHPTGIVAHRREQMLSPLRHTTAWRWHDRFPAQEKAGFENRDGQPMERGKFQGLWDVWSVHETVVHLYAPEAVLQGVSSFSVQ